MKWLAILLALIATATLIQLRNHSLDRASILLTQASTFLQSFNASPKIPAPCASSQSRDAAHEGRQIRQIRRATIWANIDDSAISQYTIPIESHLLAQLESANAQIKSDVRIGNVRTIKYELAHFKGTLTIGPYHRDRDSTCIGAQAIHVTANELFIP